MKWFVSAILIKFEERTTGDARVHLLGDSSRLHGHAIPHHLFPTLDQAGFNFPNYQPGTRWCNKCRSEAPQRIQNWPKSDKSENIATSQQDHTQVSFLNMFIFCRMLFEENLE